MKLLSVVLKLLMILTHPRGPKVIYCYFISFIGSPFARLCGVSDKLGNLLKYVRE